MSLISLESVVVLIYLSASMLLILLGLPLYFGRVPPNRLYGFRTDQTLARPDVWYQVNRVTGRWLVLTGACVAGMATSTDYIGLTAPTSALVNFAVFSLGMTGMFAHSLRTLWRMK